MRVAKRIPELLRERDFRFFWTGQTVSVVGDEVTRIALPLTAVLLLGAGAADMGWLTAAGLLPALVFATPGGVWADRRRSRRRIMIGADVGRCLVIASIPAAYAVDRLTLPHLYVATFAVGVLGELFNVCENTVYASIVPRDRYIRAGSLINGSRSLSSVAGPGMGGILVGALSAPFALLVDAVSYLGSALCLSRVSAVEPEPAPPEKGHFTAGLRWVARTALMRTFQGAVATLNFFNFVFQALFVLYATRTLGLGAGTLGVVMGAGAVGGIAGALAAAPLVQRIGIGRSLAFGLATFSVPLLLVPLATGPKPVVIGMVFIAELVSCCGVMILDIGAAAFRTALIPDALRSRVAGVIRTINYGVRPLGAMAGGWLGTQFGLRPSLWIATVGALFSLLWVLPSPLLRMRDLPSAQEPTEPRKAVA